MDDKRYSYLRAKAESLPSGDARLHIDHLGRGTMTLLHELNVYYAELRAQEEELLESQAEAQAQASFAQALFDRSAAGLIVLDVAKKVVVACNGTASSYIQRYEYLGSPFLALNYLFEKSSPDYSLSTWLHSKDLESIELHIKYKPEKYLRVSQSELPNKLVLLTIVDVTDHKSVDDLRSLRDRLSWTNQKLEESNKRLAAANALLEARAKKRNQLFGMVAHELRTPVAALSMMVNEHTPEEWQKDRKVVTRTVGDLLNTIDDMRLLINPELARPVRLEGFTISDLNGAVASSVASIVAATGVQYQQYNAIAMPLIDDEFSTDTYRVRVAVSNIVKNACLHSRGTQVWVVSRMYTDQGDDFLEWLVADNGVGIPEGQIERLFAAGERGDSEAEGSGLGLFITKSWIEEIGGAVQYRPRAKGGSEFMVRVPLIKASDVQPDEPCEDLVGMGRLETVMSQLNVLMVEDDAVLLMLGQKLVAKLVGSLQVAENGSDGLEAFDPSKHNLVLTDYFMPDMSGVEMSRKLREQGYKGVIIGITAATIGEQREEMLQAGVDMVLPKPLNAEIFKSGIAQLMDDGRFDDLLSGEVSS